MILGHERQVEYMGRALRRGKFSHAYFFYGPAHVGKFTLAKSFAKYLHCEKGGNTVCDVCRSCVLIEKDIHPSVVVLDTAHTLLSKKETRKDIPIEDIRELKRLFSFAPEGSQWRVAIINEAEKMSGEAADAFLKLLEEPGQQTLFFLVSESRDLLRPTVVSRTHPIHFSLVSDMALRTLLSIHRVAPARRDAMLSIAAGRPGILRRLIEDPAYFLQEEKLLLAVRKLCQTKSVADALALSERVHADGELRERTIFSILRVAREEFLRAAERGAPVGAPAHSLHTIDRVATLLATTNINTRLAMDVLLLGL